MIKELLKRPGAVLFIDEIHTIVGAGATPGTMDASNILKPALANGELRCIGSTTYPEFKASFERDRASPPRRFQGLRLPSPASKIRSRFSHGLKPRYEAHHGITYNAESISSAARTGKQVYKRSVSPRQGYRRDR